MKSFREIEDNEVRLKMKAARLDQEKHHYARLEMMMAEDRGEDISYEDALKLTK